MNIKIKYKDLVINFTSINEAEKFFIENEIMSNEEFKKLAWVRDTENQVGPLLEVTFNILDE